MSFILLTSLIPCPKSKPQIPRSQIQKGKEKFGLLAVTKISQLLEGLSAVGIYEYMVQIEAPTPSNPECQEGVPRHSRLIERGLSLSATSLVVIK